LFQNSSTPEEDKEILFYEHMWHDIWHEPEIDEIIKEVLKWIEQRLKLKKDQ